MKRSMVYCCAFLFSWLGIESIATADGVNSGSNPDDYEGSDYISLGTPLLKIELAPPGTPASFNFIPGPGVGYIWKGGFWGIYLYPTITYEGDDVLLAPHVVFHLLKIIDIGVGAQWRWSPNSAGQLVYASGTPIFTVGIGIPNRYFSN